MRDIDDPVEASKLLVDHALDRFSTDNLSCMIVRLDGDKHAEAQRGGSGEAAAGEPPEEKEGDFKPTALDSTVEVEEEGEQKDEEKEKEQKEVKVGENSVSAEGTEGENKAK